MKCANLQSTLNQEFVAFMNFLPVLEWSMIVDEFHVNTVRHETFLLTVLFEDITIKGSESPFLWKENLLATWILELCTTQRLDDLCLITITRAHWHDWLTDANTSYCSLWLSESTTHTCLEPVWDEKLKLLVKVFEEFFGVWKFFCVSQEKSTCLKSAFNHRKSFIAQCLLHHWKIL